MKYLFLILRVVLFLAAVGGLSYIYLWRSTPVPVLTQVLFWLLLGSTSLGLWVQCKALKNGN